MMLALIALLASALQSFELGRFFTLPEWMPTEVSSDDTPGSDPSGLGGGWYLIQGVVTTKYERVTQHFQIIKRERYREWEGSRLIYDETYPDEDVTDDFNHQHWTTVATNEFWFGGPQDYYASIERDTEFHSWSETSSGSVPAWNWRWEANDTYFAYADLVDTNVEYNISYIGRSPRMTPEIMAGVNSTFEAIYERLYEASEGYSNSWDVAKYGPKEEEHFRFDYPHSVGSKDNVFVYCPSLLPTNMTEEATNRIIKSHRFVDYNNIARAAGWMSEEFLGNGARTTIVRPHWMGALEGDTNLIHNTRHLWWSTTHTSLPQRFMPELQDEELPTETNFWSNALATFGGLSDDGIWPTESDVYQHPGVRMMNTLSWGQPQHRYDITNCKWDSRPLVGNTNMSMKTLIEFAYPRADGWAITNTTRRLFFDRLCCLNQVLGLMDRTFHEPNISYYGIVSNEHYWTSANAEGHAEDVAVKRWDSVNKVFIFDDVGSFDWGSFEDLTNGVSASGFKGGLDRAHYFVSKPQTTPYLSFGVDEEEGWRYPEDETFLRTAIEKLRVMYPGRIGDGNYNIDIRFDGQLNESDWFYGNIRFVGEGVSLNLRTGLIPIDFKETANFSSLLTYKRSYDYNRHEPIVRVGVTQKPSTDKTYVGCISTIHERGDITNDWQEAMSYSSLTSKTYYTSYEYSYNSVIQLSNNVNSAFGYIKSKFLQDYGENPLSWNRIIPFSSSGAMSVARGTKLKDVKGYFRSHGLSYYTSDVVISGNDFEFNNIATHLDTGVGFEEIGGIVPTIYCTIEDAKVSYGEDTTVNRNGLAAEGKISVLTKKNWEWKVLNRNP